MKSAAEKPVRSERGTSSRIDRLNAFLTAVLCLTLVVISWRSITSMGAFWRDEVNTLVIANSPWKETLEIYKYDTMPLGSILLYKAWLVFTPFLSTYASLRCLGFLVSLGVIFSIWWTSRELGQKTPCIAYGLLILSPLILRHEQSLRPYGPGTIFAVLALGASWRVLERKRTSDLLLLGLLSVLNMQFLFMNTILVSGATFAAATAALIHKDGRLSLKLILAGGLPLLSLAVYRPIFSEMVKFSPITRLESVQLSSLLGALQQLTEGVWPRAKYIWAVIILVGAIAMLVNLLRRKSHGPEVFLLPYLFAGPGCTAVFFILTKTPLSPWYLIPPLVVTGVTTGAYLESQVSRSPKMAPAKGLAICVASLLILRPSINAVDFRQTNMDLVASYLQQHASPNDFILIVPWFLGVSFNYYYSGQTPRDTVPPLGNPRIHRYDLLKAKLSMRDPMNDLTRKLSATLRSGNRVWIVGELPPPPPATPTKWTIKTGESWAARRIRSDSVWAGQAYRAMLPYIKKVQPVFMNQGVSPFESATVRLVQGPTHAR